MVETTIQKMPSPSGSKECNVNSSHSLASKAVVYGSKLFNLIGLKEVHQGLYKEAYLNKDYETAASTTRKGLQKLAVSTAIFASVCFGALKSKELFSYKEEIGTVNEHEISSVLQTLNFIISASLPLTQIFLTVVAGDTGTCVYGIDLFRN